MRQSNLERWSSQTPSNDDRMPEERSEKSNHNNAKDAQRPGMRFVPVKTEEQQSMLMIHRTRDLLVRQRTAAVNALRGHLAEFGIVAAKGTAKARELMRLAGDDERAPPMAREALG
jgi:transposase